MMMSKSPPGVMFYFDDVMPALDLLSNEDAGRLFRSTLEYARFGVVPGFGDNVALNMAWRFIQPQVDRDKASYDRKILQKRYAAYKRDAPKKGIEPLEFEDWLQTIQSPDNEINHPITPDNERYPSPSLSPSPSSPPTFEGIREPINGSDTALFGLLDDGPDFDALRSKSMKLLEGYK